MDKDKMYYPEEVAKTLAVEVETVYKWLSSGKLTGFKVGRKWLIGENHISRFLEPPSTEEELRKRRDHVMLARRMLRELIPRLQQLLEVLGG